MSATDTSDERRSAGADGQPQCASVARLIRAAAAAEDVGARVLGTESTADDATVLRRQLAGLLEWMREVYERYPDGAHTLPDCWLWHPSLVEELMRLRLDWLAAYRSETADAVLAGDWHDRRRPDVVARITVLADECTWAHHLAGQQRRSARVVMPVFRVIDLLAADEQLVADAQAAHPRRGGQWAMTVEGPGAGANDEVHQSGTDVAVARIDVTR